MKRSIEAVNREECVGCKACADICPVRAVSFHTDSEGFWYPAVNQTACVSCGRCLGVCPVRPDAAPEESRMPSETYAAWNKDDAVRRESTSGGIQPAFARAILRQGGSVIGCAYTEDFKGAYHLAVEDEEGFQKLMGSKYFQSDTEGIFQKAESLLRDGRPLLFVGAPCQVSALYRYLGERPQNLYTIDFICRGVSSPLLQKLKIEHYEDKGRSKVVGYRDKHKKYAWINFGAQVLYENGKERFVSRWTDEFLHLFIQKNFNMRPSCYQCRYKLGQMVSDLTIGDFWGIDHATEKDLRDGVSALMVNSERGRRLLSMARQELYLSKKPLERVTRSNPAYAQPPERPPEREKFFDIVNKSGLMAAVKQFRYLDAEDRKRKRQRIRRAKLRHLLFVRDYFWKIQWKDFFFYNYFCKEAVREKRAYIIPFKGTTIKIEKGAKVVVKGNLFLNCHPRYQNGNERTLFIIDANAEAVFRNRIFLYGGTLSVSSGAKLSMGKFLGLHPTITCSHEMRFGENMFLGRDSFIFDSNYHPLYDENFRDIDPPEAVIIEDNVWIGAKSMVLKGSHLGEGAVIGADSLVTGEVKPETIFINRRETLEKPIYDWEE